MQATENYLRDLLYSYDCVTIPGLGGFIMHSRQAWPDRENNRIYPPARYPSFNSLLSHDDGMLISAIARTEQVSYQEAGIFVRDFVSNCKNTLASGEKVILDGIGEFSSNPEGAIQFRHMTHSNFLAASFGLEPLNLYPINRLKPVARLKQKPADRKPVHQHSKQPASVRWTVILAVPVILFLLYGIIFPDSVQNLYTAYTGIAIDLGKTPVTDNLTTEPLVIYINEAPETPAPVTIAEEPVATPVAAKVTVVENAVALSPKYYIIGGCFVSEENAVKFQQELIARGFEAEKAGSNKCGQIRISYKSFEDKSTAVSYLQKIRSEENSSAWLLKY
jgi:nucleoid DNA-binding protein